MPIFFVDNDIILKLCACNLFWDAVDELGVKKSELRVLVTAFHKFRTSKEKLQKIYTDKGVERAIKIVESCQKIEDEPENDEIQFMLATPGIDKGEAILVAATINQEAFYLTTGDKKFLTALASAPTLTPIRLRLHKRVVCLEQLLLKVIDTRGFSLVRNRVVSVRTCDKTLASAFGSGEQATKENVVSALRGYVEHLRLQTDDLLIEL